MHHKTHKWSFIFIPSSIRLLRVTNLESLERAQHAHLSPAAYFWSFIRSHRHFLTHSVLQRVWRAFSLKHTRPLKTRSGSPSSLGSKYYALSFGSMSQFEILNLFPPTVTLKTSLLPGLLELLQRPESSNSFSDSLDLGIKNKVLTTGWTSVGCGVEDRSGWTPSSCCLGCGCWNGRWGHCEVGGGSWTLCSCAQSLAPRPPLWGSYGANSDFLTRRADTWIEATVVVFTQWLQ